MEMLVMGAEQVHLQQQQEQQLVRLRKENDDLRYSLVQLQDDYQQLTFESNYYQVKSSELKEILDLRGKKEDIEQKLVSKSIQNAQLATEVDRLTKEIQTMSLSVKSLGGQREDHKRMILEMGAIFKSLESVNVEYVVPKEVYSYDENAVVDCRATSLRNIQRKIEVIVEDRRLLILRCKELERENMRKTEKITALEAQYHIFNSVNSARGEIMPMLPKTKEDMNHSTSINTTDELPPPKVLGGDETVHYHKKLVGDDTSCTSLTTSPSASDGSDISSLQVRNLGTLDDTEQIDNLKNQLAESNKRYDQFSDTCRRAYQKMKHVEEEFNQKQIDYQDATSKRDQLRAHLKDVIEQYKDLHLEYDQAMNELTNAKAKINALERLVGDLNEHQVGLAERRAAVLDEAQLTGNVDELSAAFVEARDTIAALELKTAAAVREAEEAERRQHMANKKYRSTVAQCHRLQQEKFLDQTRISETESQLTAAKKEVRKYKEEAKHQRRRLTAYMRKEGISEPQGQTLSTSTPAVDKNTLMGPDLHKLFLIEASAAGKAWNQRFKILQERNMLVEENDDLKAF